MTGEVSALCANVERELAEWACHAAGLLPRSPRIDAHCHSGVDADGSVLSVKDLCVQLDHAAIDEALVAPLHQPSGYARENPRLADELASHPDGRLHMLWRIDPYGDNPAADAERGCAMGAVGIKLHPRAERFALDHDGVRAAVAVVGEAGGVVLVHAGRGMPQLGHAALQLAADVPGATIILAHAAVSDLSWIAPQMQQVDNLVVDTSWWLPSDIRALMNTLAPSQIVFGSDPPYGTVGFGLVMAARHAAVCGYSAVEMADLFGGTIARRISHAPEPSSLRRAACSQLELRSDVDATHHIRAEQYVANGLYGSLSGGSPDEMFELAAHALELPASHELRADAEVLQALIQRARELVREPRDTPAWRLGIEAALHVLVGVATPQLPVPVAPSGGVA